MERHATRIWLWVPVSLLFSILWVKVGLTHNTLDWQGIDIANHAIMIQHMHHLHDGSPSVLGNCQSYPRGSHWLAAWFMPLFDNNAIQAMRCGALLALCLMYMAQFGILRTLMPSGLAVLVLYGWQSLLSHAYVSDVNHFLWKGQYNFSRAVGSGALWLILLLYVTPVFTRRWAPCNDGARIFLAAFAWSCHIVPGTIAVGVLLVFFGLDLWERHWRRGMVGGVLTLGGMAGAEWLTGTLHYMTSVKDCDGWLPVAHEAILALWLPTWFISMVLLGRHVRAVARPGAVTMPRVLLVLAAALLVAGSLQGYLMVGRYGLGTISAYSYNSLLFVTVAAASLLWIAGLSAVVRHWLGDRLDRYEQPARYLFNGLAGVAIVAGPCVLLETDWERPYFGTQRDPAYLIGYLAEHREAFRGCYYFDPQLPVSSLYATTIGLQVPLNISAQWYNWGLHVQHEPPVRSTAIATVLVPREENPAALFAPSVPCALEGPFWHCDLSSLTKHPHKPDPAAAGTDH